MATTLEELEVLITAETKSLREGLKDLKKQIKNVTKDVEKETSKISKSISSIGKTIKATVAAAGVYFAFEGIKDSVSQFGEMEAALSNVQRTLGQSSKTIIDWANNQAAAFGMAKDQAITYSNTFSLLISSFITDQQKAANMTQNLLEDAGIIASRTGRTIDDVLMRITSGLRGETEAIEDLGIFVHQSVLEQSTAFKALANGQSWDQLSEFTKQQIRAYSILEQTMQKYGDTVAGGVSSSLASLRLQLRNLKTELGQAFAPIVQTVIPYLLKLIEYLRQAVAWLTAFTNALFKVQKTDGAKTQNKALNDFNTSIAKGAAGLGEADKKAKKLKNTLAGFDEINKISFGVDDGGEDTTSPALLGGSYDIPVSIDVSETIESAQRAADEIKAIFNKIKPTWDNFFTPWKEALQKYSPQMKNDLLRLVESLGDIFRTIGSTLDGIFKHEGYKQFVDGVVGYFANMFGFLTDGFNNIIAPLLDGFFDGFNPDKNPNMDKLMTKIGELSQKVKDFVSAVREHFAPVFERLSPVFEKIGNAISEIIIIALSWAIELIKGFYDKLNPDNNPAVARYIEQIGIVVEKAANLALIIWEKLKPALEALTPVFYLVSSVLANSVINTLNVLLSILQGVLDFLTGVFTGDWQLAWEGIKTIVSTILEISILGILKNVVSSIKDLFSPLGTFFANLWNKIKSNKEEIFGKFGSIASKAKNAVLAPFQSIASWFSSRFNTIRSSISSAFSHFGNISRNAYNAVTSPFRSIGNFFKSIFDGVKNIFKESINFLIDKINGMIDGLNSISLPDFMGGYGINIPKIPRLARGGIVDRETMFIAGEAGKEVVMPLEHNTGWISQLANKIANLLPQSSPQQSTTIANDRPLEVVLQVGQTKLGRAVIKSINQLQKQEGRVLLEL